MVGVGMERGGGWGMEREEDRGGWKMERERRGWGWREVTAGNGC